MSKGDIEVIELLEYIRDTVEGSSKVPITGKVVVDKKEILDILDKIINYLPDEIKKAQWVIGEKDRILAEARKQQDNAKQETLELMRKRIDNHSIVKEAEIKAQEIIAVAQRQAKTIRLGSREYADEILSQLEKEIEVKTNDLLMHMKDDMEHFAMKLTEDLNKAALNIRENVKELRSQN